MNSNLLKYLVFGLGGIALLVSSFLIIAAVTGTPLSELAVVGGIFPETEAGTPVVESPVGASDEIADDRRSTQQVLGDAAGPLAAFVLPAPYSESELAELQESLKLRLRELDLRERELERREGELAEDHNLYQELFAELETLRAQLTERDSEQEARAAELARDEAAIEEERRASYVRMAEALYTEGEVKDLVPMLLQANTPEQVSLILAGLDGERASEFLTEIYRVDPDKSVLIQQLYRLVPRAE